jgi:hypothetical protein
MGDSYQAIVDVEASAEESGHLAQRVVERLSRAGITLPTLDPDAVLGGKGGYRPSERVKAIWNGDPRNRFWTLGTNGLEVVTGRWVNVWAFPILSYFMCPCCGEKFEVDHAVGNEFGRAAREFCDGFAKPVVSCPRCSRESAAQEWPTQPHLGFAHLAFLFWNWPFFGDGFWTIDIPQLIAEELNHRTVLTFGKV